MQPAEKINSIGQFIDSTVSLIGDRTIYECGRRIGEAGARKREKWRIGKSGKNGF